MKLFFTLTGVFLVAGLLLTCRHTDSEPQPFLDGTPRLKSISFSEIPQENISIDQTAKVISIKMPERIPSDIDVAVELTDNAEWINSTSGARSSGFFGCDSCLHIYLKDKNDLSNQTAIDYKIKLLPTAPLKIAPMSEPLVYYIRNTNTRLLELPILNLYGNKLPEQVRLIQDKTGHALVVKEIQYAASANKLGIDLYDEKIVPGSYHIELLIGDGSLLKATQPVLITPGTADVDYQSKISFGYRVAAGKTFSVDGYNLFEREITVDLLDAQDKTYSLSNLSFDQFGRQIQVTVPATLNPGQYVMRIWQKDTKLPYGYCLRVNVVNDEQERPIIGTIGGDPTPCSLRTPVSLQRGIRIAFSSSLTQQSLGQLSQHVTLKLLSQINNAVYYGTVEAYDANRGWDPNASLTLSATVPTGLYKAIVQVLDSQNNVVAESEPYGRTLEVK